MSTCTAARTSSKAGFPALPRGPGSTLALLPPENATGNFIKVVQRLPVRIDLVDYNADQAPLFIGTSVVPTVYTNKPPTGPDAGKFLQADVPQALYAAISGPWTRLPARSGTRQ